MNNVSIVVGSVYPDIFAACKASVDCYAAAYRKIVAVDIGVYPDRTPAVGEYDTQGWTKLQIDDPPGIYPRLVNLGFEVARPDDVLLLGDDVLLLGDDVGKLQQIAYSDPSIGVIAPRVHGRCGNGLQSASGKQFHADWVESKERLAFIAVFFKRSVIFEVGLVDTRFTGYGGDDTDYCRRIQQAGYKLAVAPHINVKHGVGESDGSMSWCRRGPDGFGSHVEMQRLLDEKWGRM